MAENFNIDNISYYTQNINMVSWTGICTSNLPNIYFLTGTDKSLNGVLYKGPVQFNSNSKAIKVKFPNSVITTTYGPEYNDSDLCGNDLVTLVGSFTNDIKVNSPTFGFIFNGYTNEISNPCKYKKIEPFKPSKYTIVHSTRNGLAVYVISDISPIDFAVGNSGIYDIHKNITICEVLYPNSVSTTTYGIWYNTTINGFENYTIAGGYSLTPGSTNTKSFLVDFFYNKHSGEFYFLNWTEIKIYDSVNIVSHIQGISGLDSDKYVCACNNLLISNDSLISVNCMSVIIKRTPNGFVVFDYVIFDYPGSIENITQSVCENNILCSYKSSSQLELTPYQATYKKI